MTCIEEALTALTVVLKMNYTLIIDWNVIRDTAALKFGAAVASETA